MESAPVEFQSHIIIQHAINERTALPAYNLLDSKSVGDQLQTLRTLEQNIKATWHIQCPVHLR